MKKWNFKWILFFVIAVVPNKGWSWGAVGHRAVGIIAEKQLTPKAKEEIKKITPENLATLSVWPDQIRSRQEWRHASWYHFAKIPDGNSYFQSLTNLDQNAREQGDVVQAIVKAESMLTVKKGDQTLLANDKRNALAFLIHFIGDIHQPFHSGRPEDRGGNNIRIHWFGKSTNLHAIWDSLIISSSYQQDFANIPDTVRAEIYANKIDHPNSAEVHAWLAGYYDTWMQESVNIRLNPYTGFDTNQELYREKYIQVVNERILQAGYRLAAVLNYIFDSQSASQIAHLEQHIANIQVQLEKIMGANYDDVIQLVPQTLMSEPQKTKITRTNDFPPECEEEEELEDQGMVAIQDRVNF